MTAAYELLKHSGYKVTVFEETGRIGGIACTLNHNGNRIDIGGHRFFSKNDRIMQWWKSVLPVQGAPSWDDLLLNRVFPLAPSGPDPEREDKVMLLRKRISRIYYASRFFDYPIRLNMRTFLNMGLGGTVRAGASYLYSSIFKRNEDSLEDFIINRFGHALYRMFFENYTEKVWGIHPSKLSADWGTQRIKGLSLSNVVKELITRPLRGKSLLNQENIETSLIRQFIYPKYGPGQLWETVAADAVSMGANILTNCKVSRIHVTGNTIDSISYESSGETHTIEGDVFLSSMPIRDLVGEMSGASIPDEVAEAARSLPYRDFITVGILTNQLNIKNETKRHTVGNIIPDCWIYIQEPDVKVGRLQIFNNWSPYMVKDPLRTIWIGMEYFCNEGDSMWDMHDRDFISFAAEELHKLAIIDKKDILDSVRIRVKKAYPAYFGSYKQFPLIREYLDSFINLYCIGRNGQHRYNNMDHSMMTAMNAVKNILDNIHDKSNIWAINSDHAYHENTSIQNDF